MIAAPAYKKLLAAEPYLRRSIPTLIILFLLVVAASRFMSLMALRDHVEHDAQTILALSAGETRQCDGASPARPAAGERPPTALLERTLERGSLAPATCWR